MSSHAESLGSLGHKSPSGECFAEQGACPSQLLPHIPTGEAPGHELLELNQAISIGIDARYELVQAFSPGIRRVGELQKHRMELLSKEILWKFSHVSHELRGLGTHAVIPVGIQLAKQLQDLVFLTTLSRSCSKAMKRLLK